MRHSKDVPKPLPRKSYLPTIMLSNNNFTYQRGFRSGRRKQTAAIYLIIYNHRYMTRPDSQRFLLASHLQPCKPSSSIQYPNLPQPDSLTGPQQRQAPRLSQSPFKSGHIYPPLTVYRLYPSTRIIIFFVPRLTPSSGPRMNHQSPDATPLILIQSMCPRHLVASAMTMREATRGSKEVPVCVCGSVAWIISPLSFLGWGCMSTVRRIGVVILALGLG
jgi:hypothetical protein